MVDVGNEFDVHVRPDDEEFGDTEHSLPNEDEVKNLHAFSKESSEASKDSVTFFTRKQMYILGGLFCGLVVIIIAMSVAIAQNARSASRMNNVVNFLSDNFADRTALEENESPQKKAAKWIADEDPMNLPLPASNGYEDAYKFVQRYALAVLYYAWGGGDEWVMDYHFMSKKDECDWNIDYQTGESDETFQLGAKCNDDKEIDYLFMPGNGLDGTIPGEIGLLLALSHLSLFNNKLEGGLPLQMMYLTDLKFLALEQNKLKGSIPEWINQLSHLKFLALGDNELTGKVPTTLNSLTRLSELSLEGNQLSGNAQFFDGIPTLTRLFIGNNQFHGQLNHEFLGSLTALRELDVSSNQFTGVIPHHLLNCHILDLHDNDLEGPFPTIETDQYPVEYLLVHNNGITGRIHSSIANLKSLTRLDVSSNELTGSIPTAIEEMDQLQYLYLANNGFDAGPIPRWHNLTSLQELSLKGTNREGTIHYWLGEELRSLTLLSLDNNNLSGEIPENLGKLFRMEYLLLNQNNLKGGVPASFANMKNLKMLRIDDNDISGNADVVCSAKPDSLGIFTSDCSDASFTCPCCSNCCDDPNSSCNDATIPEDDVKWKHGYPKSQAVFSEDIVFNTRR